VESQRTTDSGEDRQRELLSEEHKGKAKLHPQAIGQGCSGSDEFCQRVMTIGGGAERGKRFRVSGKAMRCTNSCLGTPRKQLCVQSGVAVLEGDRRRQAARWHLLPPVTL
jgi:hypothetical protein